MKRWYVVNTLPHQEARAEIQLRQQGYRPWLPTVRRTRRHARRIETIRAPLFPGYLFVELDVDAQPWSPINGTFGVRRLIADRDRPAPLPADFVRALRDTIDQDGDVAPPELALNPGERVRLVAGPFVDCVGTLLRMAANGRVALLLSVLGQEVATLVSRRVIAPVR